MAPSISTVCVLFWSGTLLPSRASIHVGRRLRVEPLNDSLAVYTGLLHATVIGAHNDTTHTDLLETGFVVKRSDGWKLLCGQTAVAPR